MPRRRCIYITSVLLLLANLVVCNRKSEDVNLVNINLSNGIVVNNNTIGLKLDVLLTI